MTACIKAGVYDNLLKSLKLRTVSHPLLLRLPGGQWGVGSGEMRGCTALFQSTPTGLGTWRGRSSSFSSSTLKRKKNTSMQKNHPVFQDLEISGTQKARVQPVSSASSFLKSILLSKRYFKTLLFKHLLHYREGEGVKDTIFGGAFNCFTNLR